MYYPDLDSTDYSYESGWEEYLFYKPFQFYGQRRIL